MWEDKIWMKTMLEVCMHPCTVIRRMEIEVLEEEKKKNKPNTANINPPLELRAIVPARSSWTVGSRNKERPSCDGFTQRLCVL